jgi:transposase, IS5 family
VPAAPISFQLPLPPRLPTIEGSLDYRHFREQLLRVDQLLSSSGLEVQFIQADLQRWASGHTELSARAQQNRQIHSRRALRCTIAGLLIRQDYRGLATRLADSPLLQHFCGIGEVDRVRVPAKSTLQRYANRWTEKEVRELVEAVLQTGMQHPEKLELPQGLDLESYFLDTTCVAADIHYPVDWVLLRDATRTLMKAIRLIRHHGLKHRMEPPEEFIRRVNRSCLDMTNTRGKPDSLRRRKRILRRMDRLIGTVRAHAIRYRQLLDRQWQRSDWTRAQAEQVLRRMDAILDRLPKARAQARQRILEGQQVDSKEKLLSFYEPDTRVIVRHKAGSEVEFGNTLLLGESPQGLIVDWKLFQESAPADVRLVGASLQRVQSLVGHTPRGSVAADRAFDSEANQKRLGKSKIYNAICPRSPRQLRRRHRSWKFRRLQRRRAQTEGRIAIFKNVFLDEQLRSKGFVRRELSVTWAVLSHNLWVIARLPRSKAAPAQPG